MRGNFLCDVKDKSSLVSITMTWEITPGSISSFLRKSTTLYVVPLLMESTISKCNPASVLPDRDFIFHGTGVHQVCTKFFSSSFSFCPPYPPFPIGTFYICQHEALAPFVGEQHISLVHLVAPDQVDIPLHPALPKDRRLTSRSRPAARDVSASKVFSRHRRRVRKFTLSFAASILGRAYQKVDVLATCMDFDSSRESSSGAKALVDSRTLLSHGPRVRVYVNNAVFL